MKIARKLGIKSLLSLILIALLPWPSAALAEPGELSAAEARMVILDLSFVYAASRSLHLAGEMKIADFLVDAPKSNTELAESLNTNEEALERMMRVLVTHRIFDFKDGKYKLNEVSKQLVSSHPNSLADAVAKELDPKRWNAVGNLEHTIRSGKSAFGDLYGKTWYDYLECDPDAKTRFDKGMSGYSVAEDAAIAKSLGFKNLESVVDVGGSQGGLLAQILRANPGTSGILFDLPNTVKEPSLLRSDALLEGRYTTVGGDFFKDQVPTGADAYLVKRVIHNWAEGDAIKILQNCARAMKEGSRLYIIDLVEEELSSSTLGGAFLDASLVGLSLGSGKERTKDDFVRILNAAGLEFVAVHNPGTRVKMVEAKLARKP